MQQSFVGNFEAASGPPYGVLLDDLSPGWRRQINASFGPRRLARLRNRQAADDGCRRRSGALRCGNAANGRRRRAIGRSRSASPSCVDASSIGPVLTMPGRGQRDQRHAPAASAFRGSVRCSFAISRFPLNGAVSPRTTACLRSADGTTLSVPGYRDRSKGPRCRGTAGAPL